MKKLFLLSALVVAMALFMSSCKDDESTTGPSDLKIGEMSATVGGSSWKAQNAIFFNMSNSLSGIQIDISNPINGVKKTVSLVLATTDGVEKGNYTAVCFYQETSGLPPNATSATWGDINGTCEITDISETEIKGTFAFKGVNEEDGSTKSVQGSFYVSRQ